jgi:hypothetical protein
VLNKFMFNLLLLFRLTQWDFEGDNGFLDFFGGQGFEKGFGGHVA